jgi:putative pyrroloquinoline-quinone binding quinoprotein
MIRSATALLSFAAAVVLSACTSHGAATVPDSTPGDGTPSVGSHDWPRFGWDATRSNASSDSTGITAANVAGLTRQQIAIDGTVDASAIYLHAASINGAAHDAFFVTTTYGKTIAIDANDGSTLWEFTPSTYSSVAGTYRITTATPVADPDRSAIYAASPDGVVRKLAIADGHVLWSTAITSLPTREKIASSLNFDRGHVIATTGGYIGDQPPYQGHVAILDGASGQLLHVWNSLCSDRAGIIDPATCSSSDAAIWGRAGAVIDTATGDLFVTTGNAPWNGTTDWGDAVLELSADATRIVANYTPTNTDVLNSTDGDLGSTSPVLLAPGLVAQGGKDGKIRVLQWSAMQGTTPHKGNEAQITSTPSGSDLFTAPAVWRHGGTTWMFAADGGGTTAWTLSGTQLTQAWHNGNGGTSPVVAGGLLYVYDPGGQLRVYDPVAGTQLASLDCGGGHWNSPIVVDGKVALPEGNANSHAKTGVLNIFRAP